MRRFLSSRVGRVCALVVSSLVLAAPAVAADVRATGADYLVSGDAHLTGLEDARPEVLAPRQFEELLGPEE